MTLSEWYADFKFRHPWVDRLRMYKKRKPAKCCQCDGRLSHRDDPIAKEARGERLCVACYCVGGVLLDRLLEYGGD